ncbi:hypothetical protein V2J09_014382 [Rumex salicifolius]
MASASLPVLILLLFYLLVSFSKADDAAVMKKFAAAISPVPATWTGTAFCKWSGVNCDGNGRVTAINLNSMSLAGTLPSNLNSLSQLTILSLQGNRFSGELPSLADLSNLQQVYLDNNSFSSVPDGAFSGLSSLQILSLSSNTQLTPWKFPTELTQSSGLVTLYAGSCNITGSIPDIFNSFPGLKDLRLSFNSLTGSLPSSFAGSDIQNLWLNGNKQAGPGLTGSIDVIGAMDQLSQLWLHGNSFTGSIPDLSNCTAIFDLQLRDNQLTGVVPPSLTALPNLLNVSLQNNKLQGPYPAFKSKVKTEIGTTNSFCTDKPGEACDAQVTTLIAVAGAFGYPMTLAESWGGNGACNQWPFIRCDASGNVTSISLAKQHLNGSISPAFANLKYLKTLNLNDNNLTGTIPENLTTLSSLQVLDVSNNNISGQVPKFRTGVTVNYKGNSLIGIDTGGGGSSGSNSTGGSGGESKKSSVSVGLVVGLVIGVLILVGVILFVLYKCYLRRRGSKNGKVQNPEFGTQMVKSDCMGGTNGYAGLSSEVQSQTSGDHNEMPVFEGGNVAISLLVLRQVTNNFSDENILGKGGFGVVYKGELHDGTKIAVKRMESSAIGNKGMNEFQAEIAVLTKVRHRHLVALLGYCINNTEKLLVYEYMPQGTLAQHLFEWRELGFSPLTWKQRVTIALDVARGVEYLHSLAQSSFIHRDLKPTNILLGDDMRAKVADFGLVKNAPDGKYSMVTRLAGTFGYLAPEYAATGRVTTKVDVYAFGIILMEIITGRKALDESMPEERCHLVTWFRRILINKENIRKAIDDALDPDDETYESILKVAELAGHCTARDPHQRPDMGHSVNVLGPLVEQWRPTRQEEEENNGIDLDMSLPHALRRWQADEGTSAMFSDGSFSHTQGSIPAMPSGFPDSFRSSDCR